MAWLRLLSAAGLTQGKAMSLRKLGRCVSKSGDGVGVCIGLEEHVDNCLVAFARGEVERGLPGGPTGEPTAGQIVGLSAFHTE